jgi:hypothetical protein
MRYGHSRSPWELVYDGNGLNEGTSRWYKQTNNGLTKALNLLISQVQRYNPLLVHSEKLRIECLVFLRPANRVVPGN